MRQNVAAPGFDNDTGWGRINAAATLTRSGLFTRTYAANTTYMVVVPSFPQNPNACSFFPNTNGLIAWWDPVATRYQQCSLGGTLPPVAASVGYFVKFTTATSVTFSGISTGKKPNHEFRHHFGQIGWHMWGDPFSVNVAWDDNVKVINLATGEEKTLTQAANAQPIPWIRNNGVAPPNAQPKIFHYNPVTGQSDPIVGFGTLIAEDGYWIETIVADLTLKFPGRP